MLDMTPPEITQMLDNACIGRLCMAGRDGRPYAIPLPFCWFDGALYVRLPLTGRKGAILNDNDRVCFEVDAFADDLRDYASVLIEGRLVPVSSTSEKLRAKQANDDKYTRLRRGYRPGHGRTTPLDALPMQKIIVEQVSGRKKEPSQASHVAADVVRK